MDLTEDEIRALVDVTEQFTRHVKDLLVAKLQHPRVPHDAVIIIYDSELWDGKLPVGRTALSLTIAGARHLASQLGQVLDAIDSKHG